MPSCFSPILPRRLRRSRKKASAAEKDVYVEKDSSAPSAGTRAPSGRTRPPSPPPSSDTARTAKNAFVLCLRTLGSVSENIPFGSVLNSAIDPLLDIMSRVEQTSENERGFVQLASRIELLTPIVADKKAQEGKQIVEALERELQSIHDDIKQALSHGKIAQFFNTEDNSSGIAKHNANLTQLIGDSTQESVNEILKTVRTLEVKKEEKLKIVGGFGGSGGSGYRGGTGGDGEGPALELERENIASISSIAGGFGGTGGDGVEVGGTGGVGKAPIVKFLRARRFWRHAQAAPVYQPQPPVQAYAPPPPPPVHAPAPPEPENKRPEIFGGTGGTGGKARELGGDGGIGQGMRLNLSDASNFSAIRGGMGGTGGEADIKGGGGGLGEAPKLNHHLLTLASKNQNVTLPPLSIADFCKKYRLSPAIQKIFEEEDYASASSLLEVSEHELQDMKFKRGQIAEIKRALREYLASQNIATVA